MKRIVLLPAIAALIIVIAFGCSEKSATDLFMGGSVETAQTGSSTDDVLIQYWPVVDWDGVSKPEPNTFYRIVNIKAAKEYFADDENLKNWMNALPELDRVYSNRVSNSQSDQVLKVTASNKISVISDGPALAALTWSANASIEALNGGAIAWCRTLTTNPAGVSGFKSHQIWLFNQNGFVYWANFWETTDLLEHSVSFEIGRDMACDSTLWCMGRIVCNGVKALDTDSYTRSCP